MKNIPKLRFKEFNGEWEEKRLGDIFKIFNGYAFSSKSNINDGIILLKIANVGINKMVKNEMSFLPMDFLELYSKYLLKKGDIVIALTRPLLDKKLKIAEIDDFFNNSLLNQRVGKILSEQNKKFIYNLLQNSKYIKKIEDSISGTDPPNLSTETIKDINIIIPKLEEQEKIANFLSSVDKKISIAEEKLNLFNQYKKGIMQKIFNQELRFEDENGNNYPEWEERNIEEFLLEYEEKTITNNQYPMLTSSRTGGIVFQTEHFNKQVTTENNIGYNVIPYGYITYRTRSDDGKFVFNRNLLIEKGTISYFYPVFTFNDKLDINYGLTYLNNFIDNQVIKVITGTSQLVLSLNKLKKIKIKFPCLEEQKKIGTFLSTIDMKIEKISDELKNLKEFKKGLLQKMFV